MAMSCDSQCIASGSADNTIKMWDAGTGQCLHTLCNHKGPVRCVAFSNDGNFLASSSTDKSIIMWLLTGDATPIVLRTLWGHTQLVQAVKFSPDGSKIASASWDGTGAIWSVQSGEKLLTLDGHEDVVRCIAWSSDSKLVASGGDDENLRVWDAATGRQVSEPMRHGSDVMCVAFGNRTKILVSGSRDKTVIVRELLKGGEYAVKHTLKGHTSAVMTLSLSHDDQYLASTNTTVRVWDVNTGQQIKVYIGHFGKVNSIVWTPDGQSIVSGSEDKTIRIWRAIDHVRALSVCLCMHVFTVYICTTLLVFIYI